jgi:hypothetical protein
MPKNQQKFGYTVGNVIKAEGWVIVHPNGWIETDYFGHRSEQWADKGRVVSQRTWQKIYRPGCRMVKAILLVPA